MKLVTTSTLIMTLCAVAVLAAGVVVAQIPTEATGYRNPQCAVPSYTVDGGLYDRYGLAQESVNRLSQGAIRDNLSARLEYVYEEINIRCLEEMVGNPGGYMLTKVDVEARFGMYQESVAALRTLNDARPTKKTELIARLGVVRDALDGFALPAEACPALPTAHAAYTPSNTFAVTASVTNDTENNSFDLALDDTLSWAPDITETLYETSGQDICEFQCHTVEDVGGDVDFIPIDNNTSCGCPEGAHEYDGQCISNTCKGIEPEDASYVKGVATYTEGSSREWSFDPALKFDQTNLDACQYTCADDFAYSGSGDGCINTKTKQCSAKSGNSTWNIDPDGNAGSYKQNYSDETGWQPSDSLAATYDATSPYAKCSYRCNSGYTYCGGSCITSSTTSNCTKPANSSFTGTGLIYYGRTSSCTWTETSRQCSWSCNSNYYQKTTGSCYSCYNDINSVIGSDIRDNACAKSLTLYYIAVTKNCPDAEFYGNVAAAFCE